MRVYELAKKMELEGEEYYNKLAKSTKNKGIQRIFIDLAKDERKHLEALEFIIRHLRRAEEWVESAEFTHGEKY